MLIQDLIHALKLSPTVNNNMEGEEEEDGEQEWGGGGNREGEVAVNKEQGAINQEEEAMHQGEEAINQEEGGKEGGEEGGEGGGKEGGEEEGEEEVSSSVDNAKSVTGDSSLFSDYLCQHFVAEITVIEHMGHIQKHKICNILIGTLLPILTLVL